MRGLAPFAEGRQSRSIRRGFLRQSENLPQLFRSRLFETGVFLLEGDRGLARKNL